MATLRQPTGVRVLVAGVKGVERAAGKVASVGQILLREISCVITLILLLLLRVLLLIIIYYYARK